MLNRCEALQCLELLKWNQRAAISPHLVEERHRWPRMKVPRGLHCSLTSLSTAGLVEQLEIKQTQSEYLPQIRPT